MSLNKLPLLLLSALLAGDHLEKLCMYNAFVLLLCLFICLFFILNHISPDAARMSSAKHISSDLECQFALCLLF